MSETMTCQSKDALVGYLYDEVSAEERRAVEAHLDGCEACRLEMDALTGVRAALTEWQAPVLSQHFRIVAGPTPAPSGRRWRVALPLAAAAVLVLAAAAAVANLEIRYGADGVVVRTGWGFGAGAGAGQPVTASRAGQAMPVAAGPERAERANRGVVPVAVQGEPASTAAPWRGDLVALERQLRQELQSAAGHGPATAGVTSVSTAGSSETDLLRRVQLMLDDSEQRQQSNLALRVAELSREFNMQRQADLVQIQQGLGRLEGRTEAEAARAREIMNYIVRVSQQQPQR